MLEVSSQYMEKLVVTLKECDSGHAPSHHVLLPAVYSKAQLHLIVGGNLLVWKV